jgi:hypothetical protein
MGYCWNFRGRLRGLLQNCCSPLVLLLLLHPQPSLLPLARPAGTEGLASYVTASFQHRPTVPKQSGVIAVLSAFVRERERKREREVHIRSTPILRI